jgi:hypothetical protein
MSLRSGPLPHSGPVTGNGRSSAERGARPGRGALGYGSVLGCSAAVGVVAVLPFVMALYALEQLVLAPLGLAPVDPTNDDGNGVVVVVGVLAPVAVLAVWAGLTAALVRRGRLPRATAWLLAAAALLAPTIVFVSSRIS